MKFKLFILFLISILSLALLTGCYRVRGVEDMAYAIALRNRCFGDS